jgi:hypothetical protein
VSSLEVVKVRLVSADGFFKLLDVLGAPFPKRSLSLSVTLLPLFRGGIDLGPRLAQEAPSLSKGRHGQSNLFSSYRFATAFAFWRLALLSVGIAGRLCRVEFRARAQRLVAVLLDRVFLVDGHPVGHASRICKMVTIAAGRQNASKCQNGR